MIHVFDYPFEEEDGFLRDVFKDFGDVKGIKKQTYLFNKSIYTGTRLVSLVLKSSPPRSLTINGYICRIWYKGQPLVCNLCGVQGHKSSTCPNRDRCRRCGQSGHFARACPRTFVDSVEDGNRASGNNSVDSGSADPFEDGNCVLPSSLPTVSVVGLDSNSADNNSAVSGSTNPSEDGNRVLPSSLATAPVELNVVVTGDPVEGVSGVSLSPPTEEDALVAAADPAEDDGNISPAFEVSPAGESNSNAEDVYAFTCGQAMPDSQVSLLSPPAPSPVVSEPESRAVPLVVDVAASQIPISVLNSSDVSGNDDVSKENVSDLRDQSSASVVRDSPGASGFGKSLWGKMRSKVPVRKSPYALGSRRHSNLPPVVNDRPRPGQSSKR